MGLPVWGSLEKATDDSQTIDEAIAAAILAHEEDPTAHLGEGESLSEHKTEGVIDHPIGSVLADKFTKQEFVLQIPFESLDLYAKSGSGVTANLGGFKLDTGSTINTERYLAAPAQYSNQYYYSDRPFTMQFFAAFSVATDQTAYLGGGGQGIVNDPPFLGFKVVNNTVYACEVQWGEEEFTEYTTELTGVAPNAWHVYRVQLEPLENTAYFYVDGTLVAEMELHENFDVGLLMFSFYLKNTAAAQKIVFVGGVYYGINPLP